MNNEFKVKNRVRETSQRPGVSGQPESVPGQWRNWSQNGEGVEFGWGRVKFPCPAGPWGVLVADVTSGAWKLPSSLAAISLPSGSLSSSACPGLSADHLVKRGSLSSITLPFFYKKHDRKDPTLTSDRNNCLHSCTSPPRKTNISLSVL